MYIMDRKQCLAVFCNSTWLIRLAHCSLLFHLLWRCRLFQFAYALGEEPLLHIEFLQLNGRETSMQLITNVIWTWCESIGMENHTICTVMNNA